MTRQINAMIVEDSNMTRKMIMKDISATGLAEFSFTEASDGVEALEKYDAENTDLLLVDMQMPRMDGIQLLKHLREKYPARPPSVMITSESSEDIVKTAIEEAGVDGFLLKPVNTERLGKGLKKLIDSIPDRHGPSAVPHGECVSESFRMIVKDMTGLELTAAPDDESVRQGEITFGGISILGSLQWSVILGFERSAAGSMASRFAGFEIPADSPDCGDALSEVTNIVAGQIKRMLVAEGLDVEISLPIVSSATGLRTLAQRGTTCERRHFDSEIGKMWTSVTVGMNPGLML
jgi:two-component system chemotaxis response regulator CheY